VFVLFDEASGIHEGIWERVGGVMNEANTEKLWIATSNPSRNHGRFYECFNRFADQWIPISVDSRDVPFTDNAAIEREIAAWGIDSDYIKVRWLGLFPDAGSTQLIPWNHPRCTHAHPAVSYHYEPLILGVDVARFGTNESVLCFRRGKDARTIPTQRYRGLSTTELGDKVVAAGDPTRSATGYSLTRAASVAAWWTSYRGSAMLASESISVVSPVLTPTEYLYSTNALRCTLPFVSGCEKAAVSRIAEDLEKQLLSIEYFFRAGKREIQLIPKEDMEDNGFDSPDVADALASPSPTRSSRKTGAAPCRSAPHTNTSHIHRRHVRFVMGKKPKIPPPPPPSPTPPDFASSFVGRSQRSNMAASMGGTFLTQDFQPLVRKDRGKTVLG
jgi:hypothetical protein